MLQYNGTPENQVTFPEPQRGEDIYRLNPDGTRSRVNAAGVWVTSLPPPRDARFFDVFGKGQLTIEDGTGGRDGIRACASPAGNGGTGIRAGHQPGAGASSIFIIKSHNSDKNSRCELVFKGKVTRSQAIDTLERNVYSFITYFGVKTVAFWTLTLGKDGENVSVEEFMKMFDNMRRRLLRKISPTGAYIAVLEYQKRGAIHLHILVATGKDIQTGVKWYRDTKGVHRPHVETLGQDIKDLFQILRERLPGYGFGEYVSIMPVRTIEGCVSQYISKYMWKGDPNVPEDAGRCRRVRYGKSREWRVASQNRSWLYGRAWAWRKAVAKFARNKAEEYAERRQLGNGEIEHISMDVTMRRMSLILGPRWAYKYREQIIRSFYEWILCEVEEDIRMPQAVFRQLWYEGKLNPFIEQIDKKYVLCHHIVDPFDAQEEDHGDYVYKGQGWDIENIDPMFWKPLAVELPAVLQESQPGEVRPAAVHPEPRRESISRSCLSKPHEAEEDSEWLEIKDKPIERGADF